MKKLIFVLAGVMSIFTASAQALECSPQAIQEAAMEQLSISGKKIAISSPTPIYEKSLDIDSPVIGFSIRYYREYSANYGMIGELSFLKIGDYCSPQAINTFETVNPIQIH